MKTEITKYSASSESLALLNKANEAVSVFNSGAIANPWERAFAGANAIEIVRKALTPEVLAPVLALKDSPLGFLTDKTKKVGGSRVPYTDDDIRDALIEATMRGLPPIGNCWNLIGGRCYITKEGYGYLLDNIPGLKWSCFAFQIVRAPDENNPVARVSVRITWSFGCEQNQTVEVFQVRTNRGATDDNIAGKGIARARRWLYERLTHLETPALEQNDSTPISSPSEKVVDAVVEDRPARQGLAASMVVQNAEPPAKQDSLDTLPFVD